MSSASEKQDGDAVPVEQATRSSSSRDDHTPDSTPPPEYPTSFRLALIILTICIASFLCALDQSIVAIAVPTISDDFHALGDIAWWTSAYLLTSATLQLTYGRLYSLFATKPIYILALLIFSLGSLICAVAPNSIALILGRAIAGSGAAGIFSGSVLILAASVPLEKRGGPSGLMFGSTGIASIIAPFIGGAFTEKVSWRWCFGINLPIAAVAIAIICLFFKSPTKHSQQQLPLKEKIKRFDLLGVLLITASLVCLILALQFGGEKYAWSNARIIALFVLSGVLIISFVAVQIVIPSQRSFSPTLMGNRGVVIAAPYGGGVAAAMFVVITYLPLWFQAVQNASALASGVKFIPLIASFVVGSGLSGGIIQGVGYYNPSMLGGVMFAAIGGGLLTTISATTAQPRWIGYEVLFGFGAGAAVPSPMLAVQALLPESEVPMGISLVNLSQTLWASIFVAIAQSIFVNKLTQNIHRILPDFDTSILKDTGASHLSSLYNATQLPEVIPAYSDAITTAFNLLPSLCCAAFALALFMPWKTLKKSPSEQ